MRRGLTLCVMLLVCALLAACGSSSGGGHSGSKHVSMAGAGMAKTHPDALDERRIVLLHPQSKERLDVIYYHDGHYDAAVMKRIDYLFRDRHANVVGDIDPELIDYMVDLRTRFSLPPTVVFEVLSGYRTPATNAMLARGNSHVAIESLHMRGWAVDFRIAHVNGNAIAEIAKTMQRGGVAYYPTDNHVHVDLGNIRTWGSK